MKIILGSSSPQRQKILKDLGYEFEVIKPELDESSVRDADPRELVLKLGRAKADDVIRRITEEALVITGDSITVVNGEIREKPKDKEQAYEWIEEMAQGVPQVQVSSVVITNSRTGERKEGVAETSVVFGAMSRDEAKEFVESGIVFSHSGGYAIQKEPFWSHVKAIDGELETIIGMPKTMLLDFLTKIKNRRAE